MFMPGADRMKSGTAITATVDTTAIILRVAIIATTQMAATMPIEIIAMTVTTGMDAAGVIGKTDGFRSAGAPSRPADREPYENRTTNQPKPAPDGGAGL